LIVLADASSKLEASALYQAADGFLNRPFDEAQLREGIDWVCAKRLHASPDATVRFPVESRDRACFSD
jgi:hypothetical protein